MRFTEPDDFQYPIEAAERDRTKRHLERYVATHGPRRGVSLSPEALVAALVAYAGKRAPSPTPVRDFLKKSTGVSHQTVRLIRQFLIDTNNMQPLLRAKPATMEFIEQYMRILNLRNIEEYGRSFVLRLDLTPFEFSRHDDDASFFVTFSLSDPVMFQVSGYEAEDLKKRIGLQGHAFLAGAKHAICFLADHATTDLLRFEFKMPEPLDCSDGIGRSLNQTMRAELPICHISAWYYEKENDSSYARRSGSGSHRRGPARIAGISAKEMVERHVSYPCLSKVFPSKKYQQLRENPIFAAAAANDVELLRKLISQGGNPNAIYKIAGTTPLHFAANTGAKQAVNFLLANNANARALDKRGQSAGDIAELTGQSEDLVRKLHSAESIQFGEQYFREFPGPPVLD